MSCSAISPKLVKITWDQLAEPITCVINSANTKSIFSSNFEETSVTSIEKDWNYTYIFSNYRLVTVLSTFSKITELSNFDPVTICADDFYQFLWVGAYCKHYGTHHVLICLLEKCGANLDQNKIIGAVLLVLSIAFNCINYDILTAKLNAYGFDRETLKLIYSYVKGRKQSVRIQFISRNFSELL